MLDWLFMFFFVIAILLFFICITQDLGVYWNTILVLLNIIIWYILSASVMTIEIPYEIYNASSSQIETGYHNFTSPVSFYLVYFFMLMAVIMIFYFIGYILYPAIYQKWMR